MFRSNQLRHALFLGAIFGTTSVPGPSLQAQVAAPLRAGAPVRVVMGAARGQPERVVRGFLVRIENDSVTIDMGTEPGRPRLLSFDLHSRWQLQVRTGSESQAGSGALAGALFGAIIGGVAGAATYRPCEGICFDSQGLHVMGGAFLGAAAGSLLGLAVGSSSRSGTWVPIETSGVRVALDPSRLRLHAEF